MTSDPEPRPGPEPPSTTDRRRTGEPPPDPAAGLSRRSRWTGAGALTLGLIVLIAGGYNLWHVRAGWSAPTRSWAGNYGDAELIAWFLASAPHQVLAGHSPFFSTYLNYPAGVNLMWNTSVILPALLVAPVTLLAGPLVSYNLLITLAAPVNALATYALLRRWVPGRAGPGVGAVAFSFAPFFAGHLPGHLHLILVAFIPLIFLVLDEIVRSQRWPWWLAGAALGALAAGQLLTGEELLVTAALVAAVIIVLAAIVRPRTALRRAPYVLGASVVSLVVFAVLAGWPLAVQLAGPQRPVGPVQPPDVYVTDLLAPVLPQLQLVTAPWVHAITRQFSGNPAESNGYLGVPLLVLAVVLAITCRRLWSVWLLLAGLVVATVLSFGAQLRIAGRPTGIRLPESWLQQLPLMSNVLPGRFMLYADLAAAGLLAVGVAEALRRGWPSRAAGALAVAAVAATWLPAPMLTAGVATPAYFTTGAVRRIPAGSVAVVLPWITSPRNDQAMVWQADAGLRFRMREAYLLVPQAGGISGFGPPPTPLSVAFAELQTGHPPALTPVLRGRLLVDLAELRVQTLLVGPMRQERLAVAFCRSLLGRPPVAQDGVWAWYGVGRSLLG